MKIEDDLQKLAHRLKGVLSNERLVGYKHLAAVGQVCGALHALWALKRLGYLDGGTQRLPTSAPLESEVRDELLSLLDCIEDPERVVALTSKRIGKPMRGVWLAGFHMSDVVFRLAAALERLELERQKLAKETNDYKHGPRISGKRAPGKGNVENQRTLPTDREFTIYNDLKPYIERLVCKLEEADSDE